MTNHASNSEADNDYGFSEVDLLEPSPAPHEHRKEPLTEREPLVADKRSDLREEHQDESQPRPKKPKTTGKPVGDAKKGNWVLYGSVSAVATLIFVGIGFWALHQYQPLSRAPRAEFSNVPTRQVAASPITVAPQITEEVNAPTAAIKPTVQKVQQAAPTAALVEDAPVIKRESEQQNGALSTSQDQDDAFYDRMAQEAGKESIDPKVAATPVAADRQLSSASPGAVSPSMPGVVTVAAVLNQPIPAAGPDLSAITDQLKRNSSDIAEVLVAVKAVQATIVDLKKQVDEEGAKSGKLTGQLTLLDTRLTDLAQSTQAKFGEISKDAVTAALAAVRKSEGSGGKPGTKMVLVGGPVVPVEPQEKPRFVQQVQPRKAEPRQEARPMATATVASEGASDQCSAKTVSQIWHVKGVSTSAAYIRRDVDGAGLMVRMDMDVPGFGTVKGFDPTARTVCTSNGLIVR